MNTGLARSATPGRCRRKIRSPENLCRRHHLQRLMPFALFDIAHADAMRRHLRRHRFDAADCCGAYARRCVHIISYRFTLNAVFHRECSLP